MEEVRKDKSKKALIRKGRRRASTKMNE
jgi:hypothetical protein